ncbi:MAG TPA: peptidoglycan-binding domain-containing protein [Bryobacteraceae bacterium]|jgi:peptidoglycan hydrolase-like protein with peptidoglycan-binding domain|nr:peptidoglycan-binding domain-containing protein [Bryobacteraceae bacterium]
MRTSLASVFLAGMLVAAPVFSQSAGTIKSVQQALKDKGFDPGPVDGRMGPETRSALKSYQEKQNLTADGRIGPKTLDGLGVKQASPKKNFEASGANLKHSYTKGGKDIGQGSAEAADSMKTGHVGNSAVDFGKGIGSGVKKMAVGTGHAAKNAGKGVANAVTPAKKTDTH